MMFNYTAILVVSVMRLSPGVADDGADEDYKGVDAVCDYAVEKKLL